MAKKQGKQWNGMTSVGGVVLVLVLLFLFSPFIELLLYGGPVSNSRTASCGSNMKQLGLALSQYAQDSDSTLPRAATPGSQGWREAIYPYVKSTECYHCPDDKRNSQISANLPKSYAANAAMLGNIALADSNVISAIDSRGYEGEDWDIVSSAFLPSTGRTVYAHFPSHAFYERPFGKLNVLFADGHVKRVAPMDTLAPVNLWTRDNAPFTGQDLVNAQTILTNAENE